MGELNIYGIYVPILLVQALISYVLLQVLLKVIDRCVDSAWIVLPSVFSLCVYVVILGGVHWLFI